MRFCVLIFFCFIAFMAKASAHTETDIKPVLQFDRTIMESESMIGPSYLKLVPEEVLFPEHPQKERFDEALSLIEEIVNSDEFRQKVVSYLRQNGKREYSQNYLWGDKSHSLTNEEIYEVIMRGNEKTIQDTTGEMNLNATVKVCKAHERVTSWCRTVVGSTSPRTSKWIELNWKFYSRYETHEMVENIVHEWLHLIGFLHGKDDLHEEVPYVVGGIAGEIAKKMLQK